MFSPKFILPFLCLASAMTTAEAFAPPAKFAAKLDRDVSLRTSGLDDDLEEVAESAFNVKKGPDILGKDEDGNVLRVPVRNIERDWEFDGYTADGEFVADLFLPENKEITGCAFFMHGFTQYPIAYYGMLKETCETAGIAILAVETGFTDVFSDALRAVLTGLPPTYILQRAVSEDTKQLIRMLKAGDGAFAEYGLTLDAVGDNIAVMGHSMGGGLSFPVAADCGIDHVFVMAPAYGEPQFDPIIEGLAQRTPDTSMMLAGGWDILARAGKVNDLSVKANAKKPESSTYVRVERGLHTGFQDQIVLFNNELAPVLRNIGFLNFFLGFIDSFLINLLKLFTFFRTRTGQLDGTTALMSYFMSAMVEGKKITPASAEKYLDDSIKDKFEDKFEFSFGGK